MLETTEKHTDYVQRSESIQRGSTSYLLRNKDRKGNINIEVNIGQRHSRFSKGEGRRDHAFADLLLTVLHSITGKVKHPASTVHHRCHSTFPASSRTTGNKPSSHNRGPNSGCPKIKLTLSFPLGHIQNHTALKRSVVQKRTQSSWWSMGMSLPGACILPCSTSSIYDSK